MLIAPLNRRSSADHFACFSGQSTAQLRIFTAALLRIVIQATEGPSERKEWQQTARMRELLPTLLVVHLLPFPI